jgi:hypothetical protein
MKLLAEISEGALVLSDEFEQLGSEYQLRIVLTLYRQK